jgi:hypothetical protein
VSEAARLLGLTPGRVRQMLLSGELEGAKDPTSDRWRVSQAAVLERRAERKPKQELPASPAPTGPDVGALIDRIARLEHQLGRAEAVAELTEEAHSTTQQALALERERVARLETELAQERGKGFWSRLLGG